MPPPCQHWHLLDYIIVGQMDLSQVLDTQAVKEADCGTDNVILRSKMRIKRKLHRKKIGSKSLIKLNTGMLKDQEKREQLEKELDENLKCWDANNDDIQQMWKVLRKTVFSTASEVLGNQGRKHQDWFNEHDELLRQLNEKRNKTRQAFFQCNIRLNRKTYSKAQGSLQRYTREMKSKWWEEKTIENFRWQQTEGT